MFHFAFKGAKDLDRLKISVFIIFKVTPNMKITMCVQLGGSYQINLSLFWVGGFTAKDPTEKALLAVTAVLGIAATSRRRGL